jgi:hypothetical protein
MLLPGALRRPRLITSDASALIINRDDGTSNDLSLLTIEGEALSGETALFDDPASDEEDLFWSNDGQRVYVLRDGDVELDIGSLESGFENIGVLTGDLPHYIWEFTMSGDELQLIYAAEVEDQLDLFISKRDNNMLPFTSAELLGSASQSDSDQSGPVLTRDGQRLYFNPYAKTDGSSDSSARPHIAYRSCE